DPAVPGPAHGRRERRLQAVDVDGLGRPRAEQDADVDALDVHRLQRFLRLAAAVQAFGARALVAVRPRALALGPVRERRQHLAVDVSTGGAVVAGHGHDAATELRIEVVLPERAGLDDVQIAVHDTHAVLGHWRPPCGPYCLRNGSLPLPL